MLDEIYADIHAVISDLSATRLQSRIPGTALYYIIYLQPLAGDASVQPLASSDDVSVHLSSSTSDISVQPDASTGTSVQPDASTSDISVQPFNASASISADTSVKPLVDTSMLDDTSVQLLAGRDASAAGTDEAMESSVKEQLMESSAAAGTGASCTSLGPSTGHDDTVSIVTVGEAMQLSSTEYVTVGDQTPVELVGPPRTHTIIEDLNTLLLRSVMHG